MEVSDVPLNHRPGSTCRIKWIVKYCWEYCLADVTQSWTMKCRALVKTMKVYFVSLMSHTHTCVQPWYSLRRTVIFIYSSSFLNLFFTGSKARTGAARHISHTRIYRRIHETILRTVRRDEHSHWASGKCWHFLGHFGYQRRLSHCTQQGISSSPWMPTLNPFKC